MAAPSKIASPVAKPEKPKGAGRFITATEGWKIALVAKGWRDTPYAPQEKAGKRVAGSEKYAGGNPVKGEGADCSGSVWAIYKEAGFPYGPYANTAMFVNRVATDADLIAAWLKNLVGIDADFVKGRHFFKKVTMPQVGDIGWWNGHVAIYDNNVGKTDKGLDGNLWSARNPEQPFGPARINWYDNYVDKKTGKNYGTVKWYRYWKAEDIK